MPHYLEAEVNKKCPSGSKFENLPQQFKPFLDNLAAISSAIYQKNGLAVDASPEQPFKIDNKKYDPNSDEYVEHIIKIINNTCRYVLLDLFPDKFGYKEAAKTIRASKNKSKIGFFEYVGQMGLLDINNKKSWAPTITQKTYQISKSYLSLLDIILDNKDILDLSKIQLALDSLISIQSLLKNRIQQFEAANNIEAKSESNLNLSENNTLENSSAESHNTEFDSLEEESNHSNDIKSNSQNNDITANTEPELPTQIQMNVTDLQNEMGIIDSCESLVSKPHGLKIAAENNVSTIELLSVQGKTNTSIIVNNILESDTKIAAYEDKIRELSTFAENKSKTSEPANLEDLTDKLSTVSGITNNSSGSDISMDSSASNQTSGTLRSNSNKKSLEKIVGLDHLRSEIETILNQTTEITDKKSKSLSVEKQLKSFIKKRYQSPLDKTEKNSYKNLIKDLGYTTIPSTFDSREFKQELIKNFDITKKADYKTILAAINKKIDRKLTLSEKKPAENLSRTSSTQSINSNSNNSGSKSDYLIESDILTYQQEIDALKTLKSNQETELHNAISKNQQIDAYIAKNKVIETFNTLQTQLQQDKILLESKFLLLTSENSNARQNPKKYNLSEVKEKYENYKIALKELESISSAEKTPLEAELESQLNRTVESIAQAISAPFTDAKISLADYITQKTSALDNVTGSLAVSITANRSQARLAVELVNDFYQLTQTINFKHDNTSQAVDLINVQPVAEKLIEKAQTVHNKQLADVELEQAKQYQHKMLSNESKLETLIRTLAENPNYSLTKSDKNTLNKYSLGEISSSFYSLSQRKDYYTRPLYTKENVAGKNLKLAQAKIYAHLENEQDSFHTKLNLAAFLLPLTGIGILGTIGILIYKAVAKKNFQTITTSVDLLHQQTKLMEKIHQKTHKFTPSNSENSSEHSNLPSNLEQNVENNSTHSTSSDSIMKMINTSYNDKVILKRQYYIDGVAQSEKPTENTEGVVTFKGTYQQARAYKYKEKAAKQLADHPEKEHKIIDELISNLRTLGK